MEQSIAARIDDSYKGKGQSLETLKRFHSGEATNKKGPYVTRYTLSYQIVLPIVMMLFLVLLIMNIVDKNEISSIRNRLNATNNENQLLVNHFVNAKPSTYNLWIITIVLSSFTFVIYVIVLDLIAVSNRNLHVNASIFYTPDKNNSGFGNVTDLFRMEYSIPIIMLCEDLIILLLISMICGCVRYGKLTIKWHYILLGPLSCVAVHSYHIILGFIQTPSHAASITVFYGVTIVVFIAILRIVYFFSYSLIYNSRWFASQVNFLSRDNENPNANCCIAYMFEWRCCRCGLGRKARCQPYRWPHSLVFLILSLVSVFFAGFTVYLVVLFVINPVNMAIEGAPESLVSIDRTVLIFFGAVVTYKIVRGEESAIVAILVKAMSKATKISKQQRTEVDETGQLIQAVTKQANQKAAELFLKGATRKLFTVCHEQGEVQLLNYTVPNQQVQDAACQLFQKAVTQFITKAVNTEEQQNQVVASQQIQNALDELLEGISQLIRATATTGNFVFINSFDDLPEANQRRIAKQIIKNVGVNLIKGIIEQLDDGTIRNAVQQIKERTIILVTQTLLQLTPIVLDQLMEEVNSVGEGIQARGNERGLDLQPYQESQGVRYLARRFLQQVIVAGKHDICNELLNTVAYVLMKAGGGRCHVGNKVFFDAAKFLVRLHSTRLSTSAAGNLQRMHVNQLQGWPAQLGPTVANLFQNVHPERVDLQGAADELARAMKKHDLLSQALQDEINAAAKSDTLLNWGQKNGKEKNEAMNSYILQTLQKIAA